MKDSANLLGGDFLGNLLNLSLSFLIHEMGIADLREMMYIKQTAHFA